MEIIILSRDMFKDFLIKKGVTPDNVEQQKKVFFISIQNDVGDEKHVPYFTENKSNVLVQKFSDLDKDTTVKILSSTDPDPYVTAKAFTKEQAKEMYEFIKRHKDKTACIIHCTAGVARSGAVGVFINDFMGGDWNELMRKNKNIQPNVHVYRLLHDVWYSDHSHNDSITGKPLEYILGIDPLCDEAGQTLPMMTINPKSQDQHVAEYNSRNTDSQMSLHKLTKEEINEKWGMWGGAGKFIPFELDTNQFFAVVREGDIPVLKEIYKDITELYKTRKIPTRPGCTELPRFGFSTYYTGMTLGEWLTQNNMLKYFEF